MKQMLCLPPRQQRLKGRSLNVLWCIIWNIQQQPKMDQWMREREAGLAVVIAPVMSCGYHVSRDSGAGFILRWWKRQREEGRVKKKKKKGQGVRVQRRLFSCSLHHVLQKQLCMHAESKTCPELVECVDTLTTMQRRDTESTELSLSKSSPEIGGVNCHV